MPSSLDDALALAEQAEAEAAEAEAAEAEALATAAAARARTTKPDPDEGDEPEEVRTRRWLPRRPSLRGVLGTTAAVLLIAALAVSGLMLWRHHTVATRADREAAFVAATKQSIVNLTSLSFNSAQADVQRVIDSSTGEFRADLEGRSGDFVSTVEGSQVVTNGVVNAVGVQWIEGNTAQLLVSASTEVSNAAGAENDPRAFRLIVTMVDEGGQIKMSKVEFVP